MLKIEAVLYDWFAKMRKSGITQKRLAQEVGISSGYLSRILSGKANPKLSVLIKIDEAIERLEVNGLN